LNAQLTRHSASPEAERWSAAQNTPKQPPIRLYYVPVFSPLLHAFILSVPFSYCSSVYT